jgi:antitoxin FitA
MPTTLTLKNIPDDVYERLKASAEAHRRSLNSEAIVCLESVQISGRISPGERLPEDRQARVPREHRVFREQCEPVDERCRRQDAIERVVVDVGQPGGRHGDR